MAAKKDEKPKSVLGGSVETTISIPEHNETCKECGTTRTVYAHVPVGADELLMYQHGVIDAGILLACHRMNDPEKAQQIIAAAAKRLRLDDGSDLSPVDTARHYAKLAGERGDKTP